MRLLPSGKGRCPKCYIATQASRVYEWSAHLYRDSTAEMSPKAVKLQIKVALIVIKEHIA